MATPPRTIPNAPRDQSQDRNPEKDQSQQSGHESRDPQTVCWAVWTMTGAIGYGAGYGTGEGPVGGYWGGIAGGYPLNDGLTAGGP